MSDIEPVPTTSRKPVLPVVGSVAAVLALAVAVAYVGGGSAGDPKKLRLAGAGTGARDAALASGAPESQATGGGYVLVGTLPQGQPSDAAVWDLRRGQADADDVTALARALKAGTPTRQEGGWRAGGLFVADTNGQSWYYAPCAAEGDLRPDVRVGCAVATGTAVAPAPADAPVSSDSGSGSASDGVDAPTPKPVECPEDAECPTSVAPPPSPMPEPDPIPASTVRTAAAPILEALGLDVADARIQTWSHGGSAVVALEAGGLTAAGWETRVDVDREGTVTNASGYLGNALRGDLYPLLSAQEAFDALPQVAMERLALCPVDKDGNGCGEIPSTEITGAELGLMLQTVDREELALVPAWLFAVKGWEQPLPTIAVEPEFIESPEPADDLPASSEPGSGGGAPGSPGQEDPAPPATEPKPTSDPGTPGADPGTGRQPISFGEAYRTAEPAQVRVRYYEDGCGWDNVTHAVKESSDTVVVLLEADTRPPDQVCTEQAVARDLVVDLQAPLGERTVTDGASGRTVTVSQAR